MPQNTSQPPSGWSKRRIVVFAGVAASIAVLAGAWYSFQFVVKPKFLGELIGKAPAPVLPVSVVVSGLESRAVSLQSIGSMRAVQGIDVAPQVGGTIRALNFESGQEVTAGTVLVEIDDSVEQADLRSNQATLKNAETVLERQRQLSLTGNTPRSNLDAAQAQRDTAAAAVDRTRALIAQKKLSAPFAGRVGLRKIDLGQYVSPGTSIVTLQQLDPIYVDFSLPEQNLGQLAVGQPLDVTVDAFPGEIFRGRVSSIDARVSAETRNVAVRGDIENHGRKLLPGMFANVSLIVGAPVAVVTVPRTAVSSSLYGDIVFVVKPAPAPAATASTPEPAEPLFVVERRTVKVGEAFGDRIVIVSGLQAGETIVGEGQVRLRDSARVRIDNTLALPPAPAQRPKQ